VDDQNPFVMIAEAAFSVHLPHIYSTQNDFYYTGHAQTTHRREFNSLDHSESRT